MSLDVLNTAKPGQDLRCTVTAEPRTEKAVQTIARLMRRDQDHKRNLRRAQQLRKRRLNIYIRGGRRWASREKAADVVRVAQGAKWTMPFTPDLLTELRSVERFLTIEAA